MVLEKKNFPAENFRKVFQKPLQDKTTEIPPFLTQTRQKNRKKVHYKIPVFAYRFNQEKNTGFSSLKNSLSLTLTSSELHPKS